jgi:hypothetical protein
LLAVVRCSFATAIVNTSRIPRLTLTIGCFFAAFISDISQGSVFVGCPPPLPAPRVRGEGARLGVIAAVRCGAVLCRPDRKGLGLTHLIKLAVTPEAA